ncbi:uncharacterized protein LOC128882359 [Hylaeus volcanicus]|uniref:uncharacterized protein LOC128882359 n=1 Tax=Hylaeus volcanicus TaxID=313075 RepID=UPI0023B82918|nr:uncharacterized protein LOC128882359 [Hylaeus volcanicus]
MNVMYKGVYVPIVTNAAAGWADLIGVAGGSTLAKSQRRVFLGVTKIAVIAGTIPVDLVIADNVSDRLKARWMVLDHYVVQFLSGHGDFRAKLRQFALAQDENCTCGVVETSHHVLFDYPRLDSRWQLESPLLSSEGDDGIETRCPNIRHVLSEHGCFGEYLGRIGREPTTQCHHCREGQDTERHALEECPAWSAPRRVLRGIIGMDHMVADDRSCQALAYFCEEVMTQKDADPLSARNQRQRE